MSCPRVQEGKDRNAAEAGGERTDQLQHGTTCGGLKHLTKPCPALLGIKNMVAVSLSASVAPEKNASVVRLSITHRKEPAKCSLR
jgi:hypothetical protein